MAPRCTLLKIGANIKKRPLDFDQLRAANVARVGIFKNSKGEPAHTHPLGRDWSRAEWFEALTGELGEYANFRKKYERGDISEDQFLEEAWKELADVMIYLDLLAFNLGIDLGEAVRLKFNCVSDRIGAHELKL